MKSAISKILVIAVLLVGLVAYIAYRGGKSPMYVITHFPEEVKSLFYSLTQKNDTVLETQNHNY